MNPDLMFSSAANEWETPQDFFDVLNKKFNFTLDPCATKENTKCAKYYTQVEDGLSQSWKGETVFVNPPYGRQLGVWVRKCYEEGQQPNTTVVLLIPSRTDTRYFHSYILGKAEIVFLQGRLTFSKCENPAPFPSLLAIYQKEV